MVWMPYRVAHAVAKVDAGVTETDTSKGSSQPAHNCVRDRNE